MNKFSEELKLLIFNYKSQVKITELKICAHFKHMKYYNFIRYRQGKCIGRPNILELRDIEIFFEVDLKEYYPTDCPMALAFIEKRLLNKIALSDMHKLLGYYIRYYDLQFIESDIYGRYTKVQTKIYHDFMNFQIKKK